ncbi:hypothetical protein VX037_23690 [Gordonia sp. Z-3]|uniref:hypothetical protein n=1 Tax=Gordonia sp. Z-3 TaxID=3115408 RepID=UPI002E2D66AD|nr:hypothetical protein [Gordonia sp. Z-3]MED5804024.1 hypothetical protein [Gordonia sp. Z-3]
MLKLNKLGLAAQQVRRDKLREVLGRKTLPKGKAADVAGFVAATMWNYHPLLAQTAKDADAQQVTTELLGADALTALDGASAERRQVVNLAIVLGAHEANLPKDAWRPAGAFEYSRMGRDARTDYLRFLTTVLGYPLSDVEQVIVGDLDAEASNQPRQLTPGGLAPPHPDGANPPFSSPGAKVAADTSRSAAISSPVLPCAASSSARRSLRTMSSAE